MVARAHRAGLMTDVTEPPKSLVGSPHAPAMPGHGKKGNQKVTRSSSGRVRAWLRRCVQDFEQLQRLDHSIGFAAVQYSLRQYTANRLKVEL